MAESKEGGQQAWGWILPSCLPFAMRRAAWTRIAETSVARGMMQLTEGAWKDVTDKSYRLAFDWETNVEVGTGYLGKLKGMLGKANVFNYPRLAASYRYGYGALRKQGFLVSKMKTPKKPNIIAKFSRAKYVP